MIKAMNIDSKELADLLSIDQVGESVARDLTQFFDNEVNRKIVADLERELQIHDIEKTISKKAMLTGKTIVFTGSLENMGRSEAKAQAENIGAKVVGSVSSKTDLVVVGLDAGTKAAKAEKLGLRILSELEWIELVVEANKNT